MSSVMIRQNPHNVSGWHKYARIFYDNVEKQINIYSEAINKLDIQKAIGKPHTLWCGLAKIHEKNNDLKNARIIFEKAIHKPFKIPDDLAKVYCEWIEMEIRHKNIELGFEILHRVLKINTKSTPYYLHSNSNTITSVQGHVTENLRLWNLLCDLEESAGTIETTKISYYRMLDLCVCTPQTILNFASFLSERLHYEESFQIYERGVKLFDFPRSKDIWLCYINNFITRYKGSKLERLREIFEQVLDIAPSCICEIFYNLYATAEEKFGSVRCAMDIYRRATKSVPIEKRLSVYNTYLKKANEFFGLTKLREIYETAINAEQPFNLLDTDVKELCLRFAKLECSLGEIERTRSILIYVSKIANPNLDEVIWSGWNQFDLLYGNENTFRDMLRIKRSIGASFSMSKLTGQHSLFGDRSKRIKEQVNGHLKIKTGILAKLYKNILNVNKLNNVNHKKLRHQEPILSTHPNKTCDASFNHQNLEKR